MGISLKKPYGRTSHSYQGIMMKWKALSADNTSLTLKKMQNWKTHGKRMRA
jgi:hypothetical protein